MAAHRWEMTKEQPRNDRYRTYVCIRCGKGPIQKDIYDSKGGLVTAAKNAGISPDCNLEICKDIHEEELYVDKDDE
jgi:hypothetical protein